MHMENVLRLGVLSGMNFGSLLFSLAHDFVFALVKILAFGFHFACLGEHGWFLLFDIELFVFR